MGWGCSIRSSYAIPCMYESQRGTYSAPYIVQLSLMCRTRLLVVPFEVVSNIRVRLGILTWFQFYRSGGKGRGDDRADGTGDGGGGRVGGGGGGDGGRNGGNDGDVVGRGGGGGGGRREASRESDA